MRSTLFFSVLLCLAISLPTAAQEGHDVSVYHRQNDDLYPNSPLFHADRVSPNRSIATTLGDTEITVEWGAPALRGRPFRTLVSTYKVWRTGANEATVISFSEDVVVEGQLLSAGQYALFTIGGNKTWTIIFNTIYQQWGAFGYQRADDALRVKVTPEQSDPEERFDISFAEETDQSTDIVLRWGTFRVSFRVERAAP